MAATKSQRKVDVRKAVLLSVLAKRLPGRPHQATLLRYCKRGWTSPGTKKPVKMAWIQLPRGVASTEDAYYQFLEDINQ